MKKKKHTGLEIQKAHTVASETASSFSNRSILCVLQSFDYHSGRVYSSYLCVSTEGSSSQPLNS